MGFFGSNFDPVGEERSWRWSPRPTAVLGHDPAAAPRPSFDGVCAGFSDACMTPPSTRAEAGVREAPRHEIAVVGSGGAAGSMGILWGFGRSRRRWDGALGEQDWVAATGGRALEDSWTSGKGVEALAGGCFKPRVRRNGTHRVVADR